MTIDQQFIEFVIKSLVGNPDAVSINRTIDEKGVLLELTVDPEDLGRVIGKRGATAQSLRTLLRALGTKNEARYNLKIVDNGEPRPTREDRESYSSSSPSSVTKSDDNNDNQDTTSDEDTQATDESKNDTDEEKFEDKKESTYEDKIEETRDDNDGQSDAVRKTRAELAELDDLDI